MTQRKQRILFTPGMQCPGGCGRILNTRDDMHYRVVMCSPCGNARHAELQREARSAAGKRCAECRKPIGDQATVCRKCNFPSQKRKSAPAPKPTVYRVFKGLRGPGGEMEAEREQGRPYARRRGQSGVVA